MSRRLLMQAFFEAVPLPGGMTGGITSDTRNATTMTATKIKKTLTSKGRELFDSLI
jgi:hypothetical protein